LEVKKRPPNQHALNKVAGHYSLRCRVRSHSADACGQHASGAPLVISETASGRKVQEWLLPSLALGGGWTKDGRLLVATATEKALHIWHVR